MSRTLLLLAGLLAVAQADVLGPVPAELFDTFTVTTDANDDLYVYGADITLEPTAGYGAGECEIKIIVGIENGGDTQGEVVEALVDLNNGGTPGAPIAQDLTGLVFKLRRTLNDGAVTVTYASTDADTNNEEESFSVTRGGAEYITSAGTDDDYYVQLFIVDCPAAEGVAEPTDAVVQITDLFNPHYVPLIDATSDNTNLKTFTDTDPVTSQLDGVLTIYTLPDEEDLYDIQGYYLSPTSLCANDGSNEAARGCATPGVLPTDVFGEVGGAGSGEWAVTLADFTSQTAYLVAFNSHGISVERVLTLADLRDYQTTMTLDAANANNLLAQSETSQNIVTPEKHIAAGAITLNFGDQLSLAINPDLTTPPLDEVSDLTFQWQVNGRDITGATGETYGPVRVLDAAGVYTYSVLVSASDYTTDPTAPWFTDSFSTESLAVTTTDSPQPPEAARPDAVAFTDTNTEEGFISGTLTVTKSTSGFFEQAGDDRRHEYYLVYLIDEDVECVISPTNAAVHELAGPCTDVNADDTIANGVQIGVFAYDESAGATQDFTISDYELPAGGPWLGLAVVAYETGGSGASSQGFTKTATFSDISVVSTIDGPTALAIDEADSDGTGRSVGGSVEISLGSGPLDYSGIDELRVYRWTSATFSSDDVADIIAGGVVASVTGGGFLNDVDYTVYIGENRPLATPADSANEVPVSLDSGSNHYTHLLAFTYDTETTSHSDTAGAVEIVDRNDPYDFLELLRTRTGECGDTNKCPNSHALSDEYWPYAEGLEGGTGKVGVYWVTAALDNTENDNGNVMDDMSGLFDYEVVIGASADAGCRLGELASWPHNSPTVDWAEEPDLSTKTLFYQALDFGQLKACGCSEADLVLTCHLQLDLIPNGARTDATGSTVAADEPQLELATTLTVSFADETHASVAGVTVDNVISLAELEADITVESELKLYDKAYFNEVAAPLFTANTDSFYAEHSLTSNQNSLDMNVERVWFSPGPKISDDVELLIGSTSISNIDNPSQPGRYRFELPVPFILNCKPCYMHAVSSLTETAKKTAAATQDKAAGSAVIFIRTDGVADYDDAATTAQTFVAGAVAALVAARF